ncbi:MAG: hypothetical protein HC858_06840 [Brachymonas sp.]|nr:hypothetical protein [Brachymonas sp.]
MQPSRRAPDLIPINHISIPAKFDTQPVNAQTISRAAQPCLPWLLTASGPGLPKLVEDIEKSKTGMVSYTMRNSGNLFVIHREQAFCVQRSTAMLPILAAEALMDTAHPVGLPAGVLESWHSQIARRLAVVGQAKVAYSSSEGGNTSIVHYWLNSVGSRLLIKYSHTFKKAGEWEKDLIDLHFSHPQATRFLVVRQSAQRDEVIHEKNSPIEHRFRPLMQSRP